MISSEIEQFEKCVEHGIDLYGKEKDVVDKHRDLWQELWPTYDEEELRRLIDSYTRFVGG